MARTRHQFESNGAFSPAEPLARIHLIGPMRAETPEGASVLPHGRKAQALVACLCLAGGKPVPRARLAGELWERVPDAQARVSLRQALHEVGRAMGALRSELLVAESDAIRLRVDRCWIDVLAVPRDAATAAVEIADLHPDGLLEGFDGISAALDQRLLTERARLADALRAMLEAKLHEAMAANSPAERTAAARRMIAFDPAHEGACRALMRALAEAGERAQALQAYMRCREALRLILDVEPSGETRALYEAIKYAPTASGRPAAAVPGRLDGIIRVSKGCAGEAAQPLRIGVMAFAPIGPGVDRTLALALSQDIAAALARFRRFDVIAPSAFDPQDHAVDLALRDGDLDYAVDGAITAGTGRLRISVRLMRLEGCVSPVWSESFEVPQDDLGRLDELVTARAAARIDPAILFRESRGPRTPLGATVLTMRAMPMLYTMERAAFDEAGRILEEAVRREPDNVMATAWAAYWQVYHIGQGWARDVADARKQAQDLGLRAIRLDPNNAEAAAIYGHLCSFLDRDFDAALHYFDRAQRLNPTLGLAWALSAATSCYVGDPAAALSRLDRYRELAPFDPYLGFFESISANANTLKGDYEQAVRIGRRAVRANPDFVNGYKALIASLGHLGRLDEAAHYRTLLACREPGFSIESFLKSYPFQRDADRDRYAEGLRLAGVPESGRAPAQPRATPRS